jgi:Trk-type K+ transport system membrane component
MTAPVTVSFGKCWNVRTAQAVIYPLKSNDFLKTNSEVFMRYLYAGILGCLCSSLAWAAVDDAPAKNKTQQHAHVQKMAKANAKAAHKLSPAELANLATQNEIAQRRAALAASAAAVTTMPTVGATSHDAFFGCGRARCQAGPCCAHARHGVS